MLWYCLKCRKNTESKNPKVARTKHGGIMLLFLPEKHLRQPEFTYIACRLFTKNKERIQKLKQTGDSRYIYENHLDKACFQHDMTYGDFTDLTRRTASNKIIIIKHVILLKIQNITDINVELLQ